MSTPVKKLHGSRSQVSQTCRVSENFDPNLTNSTPRRKIMSSPVIKSAKTKKSAPKTPTRTISSPPSALEKKSVATQKKIRSEKKVLGSKKRPQLINDAPNPSCKELFKDQGIGIAAHELKEQAEITDPLELTGCLSMESSRSPDLDGSSNVRKIKRRMLEEARSSIPDPGCGRVMHLVQAFEKILTLPKESEGKRLMTWALPGLEKPPKVVAIEGSPSPTVSSWGFSPSEDFERDSSVHSSIDSNDERLSSAGSTSDGARKSRRNSYDSSERSWNKKLRVTSQQPFKLRTEQRGRLKEEHFLKKVKDMLMEEEKQRIPIAQGIPWTTDEPECLVKPFVKESTETIDLDLHSDIRAIERAEFDNNTAQRMSILEHVKLERERRNKMEEDDAIRRLRRELIPRAQPMPYFDRPFIPKKLTRHRKVLKEPRVHAHTMKAVWEMMDGQR